MSEPIEDAGAPDTGGAADSGSEPQEAVEHSNQFLDRALERAGAERDTSTPQERARPSQAQPSQEQGLPRQKSPAQLRHEARLAERRAEQSNRMRDEVLARIAAALDAEDEPEQKAVEDDDPEPDPELDWREWNNWSRRQTVKAVQAQVAPIHAFFETLQQQRDRERQEREQASLQVQQVERVRSYLAAETAEYEKLAPGYMQRVNASFLNHVSNLTAAGVGGEEAKAIAGNRIMEMMSEAGRRGWDPFEFVDKLVTNELRSLGYEVPAAASAQQPDSEIAQRRAAASTPVAGSLGQGGRPQGPQSGASSARGAISQEALIAKAKKKYGLRWRENIMKIAGEAAAAASSPQRVAG